jgi:transmembrane sensor
MKESIAMYIIKYRQGTISDEERSFLTRWLSQSKENQEYFERLVNDKLLVTDLIEYSEVQKEVWKMILKVVPELSMHPKKSIWKKWLAAAVLFTVVTTGLFLGGKLFKSNSTPDQLSIITYPNTTLALENGTLLNLDSLPIGELTRQDNIILKKIDSTHLLYSVTSDGGQGENSYNTIYVAKGKRWHLTLPDATSVWLNSASQLSYSITPHQNERIVQLLGEGYFDVAKVTHGKKHIPFRVKVNDVGIQVLGTRFNVKGFLGDSLVTTTLLEGKVSVLKNNKRANLRPGQAATINRFDDDISIQKVDTCCITDWIKGSLVFEGEPFIAVMEAIERRFNVTMVYDKAISPQLAQKRIYYLSSPRQNLESFLKGLGLVLLDKISFKLDGSKVYVKEN